MNREAISYQLSAFSYLDDEFFKELAG